MEILLYSPIYSYSAQDFINSMNDPGVDRTNATVRINCDGGDVRYGWGIIAKWAEFEGEKTVKIDGKAYSMAAFFPCYTDNVECLDVSEFIFHRAAFADWWERDFMTDADKLELMRINKHLETALRSKVDVEKFEKITGITIKDMFSLDSRIDATLTAQQAKQIGLVNKIIKITPEKSQKIQARKTAIAAKYEGLPAERPQVAAITPKMDLNSNNRKMTIEAFKAEHPEVFAQAVAQGVSQERDRVGAWAVFNAIDPEAVVTGIKSGENISQTALAEFQMKSMNGGVIKALNEEGKVTPKATTDKVEDAEISEVEKAEAEALAFIKSTK